MRYATRVLPNGAVQAALKADKDTLEGVYQSSPLHSCTHPPPSLSLKQLPCSFLSTHLTAQLVFIFGPFVPPGTCLALFLPSDTHFTLSNINSGDAVHSLYDCCAQMSLHEHAGHFVFVLFGVKC